MIILTSGDQVTSCLMATQHSGAQLFAVRKDYLRQTEPRAKKKPRKHAGLF